MNKRFNPAGRIALGLIGLISLVLTVAGWMLNHGAGPIPVTYRATGSFAPGAEYPTTNHAGVGTDRWASWHGSDDNKGSLQSTPFRAPLALTLRIVGGTGRPNQHIDLVGPDGKTAIPFTSGDDAGESYTLVKRIVPLTWYHRMITLRATDDGGGFRGWIGLSDLRAARAVDFVADAVTWLDNNSWIYTAGIFACLIALTIVAFRLSAAAGWTGADDAFIYLTLLTFFWMRWPIDIGNVPYNPDEGQTTAQAIKSIYDIVPWHGFDPTTSGPLNSYILAVPSFVGIVPNLVSTHVMGTLLVAFVAVALFVAGKLLWGSPIAACSAIAFIAIEALTRETDFIHTSSELLPDAFLAAELWLLAVIYRRSDAEASPVPYALLGLLAGATPFAKLQAIPTAAIVTIAALLMVFRARDRRALVAVGIGLFIAPLLLLGSATITGGAYDVYESFIVANFSYTNSSLGYRFEPFNYLFNASQRFGDVLRATVVLCVVAAAWLAFRRHRIPRTLLEPLGFVALLVAITAWEAFTPHRYFPHYLALIAVPAAFFISAVASVVIDALPERTDRSRYQIGVVALCAAVFLGPPLLQSAVHGGEPLYGVAASATYQDPTAEAMLKLVHPGDRVAIWGWAPALYDYTGTVMATRDCCSLLVTSYGGALSNYYRARYLNDFNAHRPALVVDPVAPGAFYLNVRATQGIEHFPELYAIVKKDYALVEDRNGIRYWVQRKPARG